MTLTINTQRTQRITLDADDLATLLREKFDLPEGQAHMHDENDSEVQSITVAIRSVDQRALP